MAQERGGGAWRLARRYGVTGRASVALACVAVLAVVLAVVLARGLAGRGTLVERASGDDGETVVPAAAEAASDPEGSGEGAAAPEGDEATTIVVHVDGAVAAPGVYELPVGSRVNDATLAAGGLRDDADTSGLNLAAALADGDKVHVPTAGEAAATPAETPAEASEPALININTADAAELDELPGVGESTAAAIIEDRERNGPFVSVEDLMRVSGIGEKKFEKLVGRICV